MRNHLILLICLLLGSTNADAQYYNAPNASAYNPINNRYLITNQGSGEVLQIDHAGNKNLNFRWGGDVNIGTPFLLRI